MSTKRAYQSNQERQRQLATQQSKIQQQKMQQQIQAHPKQKMMGTKESFEFIWKKIIELESQIKMNMPLNNIEQQNNQDVVKLKQDLSSQKKEIASLSNKISSTSESLTQIQMMIITLKNELNLLKNELKNTTSKPKLVDENKDEGEPVNIVFTPGEDENDEDDDE